METYSDGYDIDGIICREATELEKRLCGISRHFINWIQAHRQVIYAPPAEAILITGRTNEDAFVTVKWLRRNNIMNPVSFNPLAHSFDAIVISKTIAIRRHRLQRYYESELAQAEKLKKFCPDTEIILWKRP